MTPELIAEEKPDALLIGIGSQPIILEIPGADGPNVFESRDVLSGTELPAGNVVVIGGGLVGMEVAEHLAQQGRHITVVEMKDAILTEMGMLRKIGTQMSIAREDITVLLNTSCKRIEAGSVVVEKEGGEQALEADAVVLAIGSRPRDSEALQEACRQRNIPFYVYGDALAAPWLALNAIHEAYDAALKI